MWYKIVTTILFCIWDVYMIWAIGKPRRPLRKIDAIIGVIISAGMVINMWGFGK